jgi:hypothetical protein
VNVRIRFDDPDLPSADSIWVEPVDAWDADGA